MTSAPHPGGPSDTSPSQDGAHPSPDGDGQLADGQELMAVTNAVVRALKAYVGKGPSKAKCSYRDGRVLVAVEDWTTSAERTWLTMGREDLVVRFRRTFEEPIADAARGPLHELTHRGIAASRTEFDFDTGEATLVFVLERDPHRSSLDRAEFPR